MSGVCAITRHCPHRFTTFAVAGQSVHNLFTSKFRHEQTGKKKINKKDRERCVWVIPPFLFFTHTTTNHLTSFYFIFFFFAERRLAFENLWPAQRVLFLVEASALELFFLFKLGDRVPNVVLPCFLLVASLWAKRETPIDELTIDWTDSIKWIIKRQWLRIEKEQNANDSCELKKETHSQQVVFYFSKHFFNNYYYDLFCFVFLFEGSGLW